MLPYVIEIPFQSLVHHILIYYFRLPCATLQPATTVGVVGRKTTFESITCWLVSPMPREVPTLHPTLLPRDPVKFQ